MSQPYAEVIGDPVFQSKSPLIHRHWIKIRRLSGDYRASHVRAHQLAAYFAERRADPLWRGCNVTLPHKETAIAFIDELDERAARIGAINCVRRTRRGLMGYNSDVDGILEATRDVAIEGENVVIIGAGGAARAAVAAMGMLAPAKITVLVRDPKKAIWVEKSETKARVRPLSDEACSETFQEARLLVNATPLGMRGSLPMPRNVIEAVAKAAADTAVFDMVYEPLEAEFLAAARRNGLRTIDGLSMLIGQARKAFAYLFAMEAPHSADGDEQIRELLTGKRQRVALMSTEHLDRIPFVRSKTAHDA